MHHLPIELQYSASLCDVLYLSTRANVSLFVLPLSAWLNVSHIQCPPGMGHPRLPYVILSASYTDWVFTLLTTISCLHLRLHGA